MLYIQSEAVLLPGNDGDVYGYIFGGAFEFCPKNKPKLIKVAQESK